MICDGELVPSLSSSRGIGPLLELRWVTQVPPVSWELRIPLELRWGTLGSSKLQQGNVTGPLLKLKVTPGFPLSPVGNSGFLLSCDGELGSISSCNRGVRSLLERGEELGALSVATGDLGLTELWLGTLCSSQVAARILGFLSSYIRVLRASLSCGRILASLLLQWDSGSALSFL